MAQIWERVKNDFGITESPNEWPPSSVNGRRLEPPGLFLEG